MYVKKWQNVEGLNRDLNPGPLAPKARIIPLDHWALVEISYLNSGLVHSDSQGHLTLKHLYILTLSFTNSKIFKVEIKKASIAQWQSVGLVNQRSWVQSSLEANIFFQKKIPLKKGYDPDVIRTRSLLIWSQTRYRCATESTYLQREKIEKETKWRFYRDLNSDRWIQSPEC